MLVCFVCLVFDLLKSEFLALEYYDVWLIVKSMEIGSWSGFYKHSSSSMEISCDCIRLF